METSMERRRRSRLKLMQIMKDEHRIAKIILNKIPIQSAVDLLLTCREMYNSFPIRSYLGEKKKQKMEANRVTTLLDLFSYHQVTEPICKKIPDNSIVNLSMVCRRMRSHPHVQRFKFEFYKNKTGRSSYTALLHIFRYSYINNALTDKIPVHSLVSLACSCKEMNHYLGMSLQREYKDKERKGEVLKLIHHILSHLPPKILLQFKSVSKAWNRLISSSPFIDLHLSHYKSKLQLLVITSADNSIIFSEYGFEDRAVSKVSIPWFLCSMLKPVNGLFCLLNEEKYSARIYNLGTRQASPWVRTSMPKQDEGTSISPNYGFGFDPSANKHKVSCIWDISRNQPGYGMIVGKVDYYCEVLTVGDNVWKKVNEVPPVMLYGPSVYANGSIYRRNRDLHPTKAPEKELIVAFDLTTEKFRVIPIPTSIINSSPGSYPRRGVDLLQVDNHIALIDRVNETSIKLWICDDYSCKPRDSPTNWTLETIELPFSWKSGHSLYVTSIDGRKELIIRSTTEMRHTEFVTVFLYDRVNKSHRQIDISDLSLEYPFRFGMFVYHPSLLPVQVVKGESIRTRTTTGQ